MIRLAGVDDATRDGARRAAQQELLDHRYSDAQPPLLVRVLGRALRGFVDLLARAAAHVPGGGPGLLLLGLLLAGLVAVVLARLRPGRRLAISAEVFVAGAPLSAEEHRTLAERAAAAGQWKDAVRERLRALVRELECRGMLEPRPARTAGEVARDGGAAVPSLAGDLHRATTTFDETWYGGRDADATSYAVVVAADLAVRGVRLVQT